MKNDKEKIENQISKIKKIEDLINTLYDFMNKIYNDINSFNNRIEKQYLYNKSIFESYNPKQLNYYSIMNIKNFNYNKEEIKQFQKTSDIN